MLAQAGLRLMILYPISHSSSLNKCQSELIYPTLPNTHAHLCCSVYCYALLTLEELFCVYQSDSEEPRKGGLHSVGRWFTCSGDTTSPGGMRMNYCFPADEVSLKSPLKAAASGMLSVPLLSPSCPTDLAL